MTLLSAFGGGLWIIPLLTIVGAVIFGYKAYLSSKSNSTTTDAAGNVTDNTGNVPVWQLGYFWFSVICFVATIAIVWIMIAEK